MSHEKLIIVGSGPAGLTAALYAARADLDPLVFEGVAAGGQLMITTDVENYPGFPDGILGPELMDQFRKQAERFGARLQQVDVTKVDFDSRPLQVNVGADEYTADAVMIDSHAPGTGQVFDWSLADAVPVGTRFILAGGLTPANVGDAIERVRPWGVDVSSGVETSPGSGRKDARRVRRFIEVAREAGQQLASDGWVPSEYDDTAYDWQVDERRV